MRHPSTPTSLERAPSRAYLNRMAGGFFVAAVLLLLLSMLVMPNPLFELRVDFWEGRLTAVQLRLMALYGAVTLAGYGLLTVLLPQYGFMKGGGEARVPGRLRDGLVYAAAVALSGLYLWLRLKNNEEHPLATLEQLANGEALAPFQYRALVPWIAGTLYKTGFFGPLKAIYAGIEGLAALALFPAFSRYLGLFFDDRARCRLLALTIYAPLICTYALAARVYPIYYPYDTPMVALFTVGLWAIYRKRWGWYYVLFIAGTFMRETTCFLTMIYAITAFKRVPFKALVGHVGVQFVLWVAVKFVLLQAFPDAILRSGEQAVFESYVGRNLEFLSQPLSYAYLFNAMGGLWVFVLLLVPYVPDGFTRRALLVGVPFMAGMLLVGILAEVRIYGELIPLFASAFLMLLHTIGAQAGAVGAAAEGGGAEVLRRAA